MGSAVSLTPVPRGQEGQLEGSRPFAVHLRPAGPADCDQVWIWRNDPETRKASFNSAEIQWDIHERWFNDALHREDRKLFVIVADETSVGTGRLDIVGHEAAVSIHLAREWRGRGVGSSALRALAELAFRELRLDRLLASVKPDNHASLAAFAKAGFTRVESGLVVRFEKRRAR
jgi:UDP-2,4-diacetamido-2,4,6-trideoxy-beta-L-altropyranose hydrolase